MLFLVYNLPTCFKPDAVNKIVTRERGRGREGKRERESWPRSQTHVTFLDYPRARPHLCPFLFSAHPISNVKHTASSSMEPAAPINPYEGVPRHDRMRYNLQGSFIWKGSDVFEAVLFYSS